MEEEEMKKVWNVTLACLLAAALLLGMVACGNGSQPSSAGGDAPATSGDEVSNDAPAPESDDVELTFWELPYGPTDTYGPAIQKVLDEYEQSEGGCKVNLEVLSWSGYIEQFQTAIAAGSPPDITTSAYYGIVNYDVMGEALDLSSIVEKWEAENDPILDDFLPGWMEMGQHNGKQIALPYEGTPTTIYYRADILEDELGFTDLDKPVTWDKLLEICEAVKQAYGGDMYGITFFTLDQGSTLCMMNTLLSNGVGWIKEDASGPALDDPRAKESLEFLHTMWNNGYMPEGMATYNQADIEKLYQSGKVAMVWNAPVSHLYSNPEVAEVTKMMAPPMGPSATQPVYSQWAGGIMGFEQTKYPEQVKHFLEWFVKNNNTVFTEGGAGQLPARESFFEDPFYSEDWAVAMYSQYREYYVDLTWPAQFSPPAVGQIFNQNMLGAPFEAMMMGSTDLDGDLEKAQAQMQAVFDQFE